MFRPQIKVIDCTIRDGGLMNKSNFSFDTVKNVYKAACAAGIDMVEIGYRNSKKMFSVDEYGPWRFCDEENLMKIYVCYKFCRHLRSNPSDYFFVRSGL